MLVDDVGDVTVTNDGATILKLLEVEHPAAKARPQSTRSAPHLCPKSLSALLSPPRRSLWSLRSSRMRRLETAPRRWSSSRLSF